MNLFRPRCGYALVVVDKEYLVQFCFLFFVFRFLFFYPQMIRSLTGKCLSSLKLGIIWCDFIVRVTLFNCIGE